MFDKQESSKNETDGGDHKATVRNNDSDVVLITACLQGNLAAWEALIDRYQGFIFGVALRRGLSRSDAEDVFQNVCIKLYEHLADLRDVTRLAGWLASVATREAAQIYRRDVPKLFSETQSIFDDAELGVSVHAEQPATPEDEVLSLERSHLVRLTMADLSEECRRLITLLYAPDNPRSYNDIGAELGMPLGSIGPRRARCLARLRSLLAKFGY